MCCRHELQRGIIIGVLATMVMRSIAWLAMLWEHPGATEVRYGLNIVNVVICSVTAWATWRPDPRVQAKLERCAD